MSKVESETGAEFAPTLNTIFLTSNPDLLLPDYQIGRLRRHDVDAFTAKSQKLTTNLRLAHEVYDWFFQSGDPLEYQVTFVDMARFDKPAIRFAKQTELFLKWWWNSREPSFTSSEDDILDMIEQVDPARRYRFTMKKLASEQLGSAIAVGSMGLSDDMQQRKSMVGFSKDGLVIYSSEIGDKDIQVVRHDRVLEDLRFDQRRLVAMTLVGMNLIFTQTQVGYSFLQAKTL